jgi:hypothetical protein
LDQTGEQVAAAQRTVAEARLDLGLAEGEAFTRPIESGKLSGRPANFDTGWVSCPPTSRRVSSGSPAPCAGAAPADRGPLLPTGGKPSGAAEPKKFGGLDRQARGGCSGNAV